MSTLRVTVSLLALALFTCRAFPQELQPEWKAGVAKVTITPQKSMWMAGYAARKKPSAGKVQDLFAKALALEDAKGGKLVIVTLDLIGIPRAMRDWVEKEVHKRHGVPPHALLLNASHTHCGPVVRSGGSVLYALDADQTKQVEDYVGDLQEKIVTLIGKALEDLAPARLSYSRGRAGFAMNRRLPTPKGYVNSPFPDGPVHHDVPVVRVDAADGKLRAVLFNYACHNTTLSFYNFCGDYAGYAQEYLEEAHPGAVALFVTGCGGDQNPYPRGTVELAQQHGRALANAVEAALLPKSRPVSGPIRTALEEATLQFAPHSREEWLNLKQSKNPTDQRRAQFFLDQLDKTGTIKNTYPYLVQTIQFGGDLTLVALAGEVVVDYALRLHQEIGGNSLIVAGYSNDVFGYVPSVRVLKEGGYEGGDAMRLTLHPGPFAATVEEKIVAKVHDLVKRVRGGKGSAQAPRPPEFPFDASAAAKYQKTYAAFMGLPMEWTNDLGMTFVLVPPGTFFMGSPEDEPGHDSGGYDETRHQVTLTRPFYLSKHETTVAQFRRFVEETKYITDGEKNGGGHAHDEKAVWIPRPGTQWRKPGFAGSFTMLDKHPIVHVSHADSLAFCQWLNAKFVKKGHEYGLPTEAQWEWACRAGSASRYWWGPDVDTTGKLANVGDRTLKKVHPLWPRDIMPMDDGHAFLAPVGSYRPNAFGLSDMLGNVWEFCATRYGPYPKAPVIDPGDGDPKRGFAVRGGGWSNHPLDVRCASRNADPPHFCHSNLGFRVAVAIPLDGGT